MDWRLKILCLITFISCTPSEEAEEKGEWYFCNDLKIVADGSTRGLSDKTTLRAMLYSLNLETEATDTYVYLQSEPNYLKLCQVNDDGTWKSEATDGQGIHEFTGYKYLTMVSPALPVVDWNTKIKAIQTTPEKEVYATTQLEKFDLGEYAAVKFTEPMHDIRSKISFIVRNSSSEHKISNVQMTLRGAGRGQGESIYYFPATRQCMVSSGEVDEMTIQDFTEITDDSGSYQQSGPHYILSGIYAPRSVTAEILRVSSQNENILEKQFLSVDMTFNQGAVTQNASFLLNTTTAELKPRHHYTFEISIASFKIQVVLHIKNYENIKWESSGNAGSIIGGSDETIPVGEFSIKNDDYGNWVKPDSELDQTIDNN